MTVNQCNGGYGWIQDKVYTHVLIQGSKEVRQIQFPASFTCRQDAALYGIKDPGKSICYFFIIWGLPSTKLKAVVCATIYRRTIEVVGVIYRCSKTFTRANESIMLFKYMNQTTFIESLIFLFVSKLTKLLEYFILYNTLCSWIKVNIFWEGHKILQNLPLTFDYST
jgi:hypothetical protein